MIETIILNPSDYFFILYCLGHNWERKDYSSYRDTIEYHKIFTGRK